MPVHVQPLVCRHKAGLSIAQVIRAALVGALVLGEVNVCCRCGCCTSEGLMSVMGISYSSKSH